MVTELQSVALPTWLRNHNNPLREIYYSNQKILITNDVIDYSTSTVRHIKLEDFLMMEELYMDARVTLIDE